MPIFQFSVGPQTPNDITRVKQRLYHQVKIKLFKRKHFSQFTILTLIKNIVKKERVTPTSLASVDIAGAESIRWKLMKAKAFAESPCYFFYFDQAL